MFYFLSLDPPPGAATQGAPAHHDDPPPSLGLAHSPGPDHNSPKLKQTNTNNQMNKRTVLTLMLPIQYTTVQYSNRRGGWCHSTFHSVWCQRAGLAVCHQCKKRDEEEERREGGNQLGFGILTRRYGGLWPHTSSSCGGLREALWAPWQVGVIYCNK